MIGEGFHEINNTLCLWYFLLNVRKMVTNIQLRIIYSHGLTILMDFMMKSELIHNIEYLIPKYLPHFH
jgi:hypothetical protein